MNMINKLTILLFGITGSVLLTGCSSNGKTSATKTVQQNTASTFEYGIPKAYFGKHSKYYLDRQNRYTKSEYDTQHVYGMGTYILDIASNKPTKLSFTECGEINYTHPKIINVACYPENSAKLTIDEQGDLQILPQKGHIRTEIIVEAENGLKQHFLAYFVNKKATPIKCLYSKNMSFIERGKWFMANTRNIDFKSELDIAENIQLRKEFIAFMDGLRKDKEASPSKNKEMIKILQECSKKLTSDVKNLKLLKQRLADKSSKNKIHSKNKSKQFSANHETTAIVFEQAKASISTLVFSEFVQKWRVKPFKDVLSKIMLEEELKDVWEMANAFYPKLPELGYEELLKRQYR